jgi:HPt (histidine-containing phosphotransfer) domain-containing protein
MATPAKAPACEKRADEAAPSGAPIDHAHLRRYTLGDARLEQEVLWLFIDRAPASVEALRRASSSRDWQVAAHTLKGSARAVGAWRLAKLAEQAEKLGGTSDRAACEALLNELEEAAAEAHAHIAALDRAT